MVLPSEEMKVDEKRKGKGVVWWGQMRQSRFD